MSPVHVTEDRNDAFGNVPGEIAYFVAFNGITSSASTSVDPAV